MTLIFGTTEIDILRITAGVTAVYALDGDDFLYGDEEDNILYGNAGNDQIYGGLGNDILVGDGFGGSSDIGNDIIRGGEGNDKLYGRGGNDFLRGEAGNDKLYGDEGNDTLKGGDGNDVLRGGDGADFLEGNAGADYYVFEADSIFNNIDTISGFIVSEGDKLYFSDILESFDPLNDLISNFIDITAISDTKAALSVDVSGSGESFSAVALITNTDIANLPSVEDLYAGGNIIV